MDEQVEQLMRPLRELGFSVGWCIVSKDGRDVWQADAFRGRQLRITAHGETLEKALENLHAEIINRVKTTLEKLDLK